MEVKDKIENKQEQENNLINQNSQNNCSSNNCKEIKKDKEKNKKIIILIIIISVVIAAVAVIFGFAYAKYVTTVQGSATAQVAQMICELEVVPSEAKDTIINPYCMVTVKNYNADSKVTETDINFKIEVSPKGDFVLPEYYWEDSNGTIVAQSTEVTGNFEKSEKEDKKYKIVFLNSGEEDITRLVEFNLVAIQGNE